MDRLCDKLGFPRTFFLNQPAQDEDSPLFWRSNASATKMARERCYPRLRWLKEITTYQKQFLEFPKLDLPRFHIPDDFKSLTFSQIDHLAQGALDFHERGSTPTRVALLGHAYWPPRFGPDPGVLGRTITIDEVCRTSV